MAKITRSTVFVSSE